MRDDTGRAAENGRYPLDGWTTLDGMPIVKIMTSVSAIIPADREDDLLDGYRALIAGGKPEGLLRSELLRGQEGKWLIQTLWRDRAAILAARASGELPTALVLLQRVGAEHVHDLLTVEEQYEG